LYTFSWAAPDFFCLGGSVGQTEGHRGQKTKAGASEVKLINPLAHRMLGIKDAFIRLD